MPKEFLIVGQGLAGSVLALELLARGCSVTVLDDAREGSASRVAAGMFNPMSFRRIIPVWRADEVMAAMEPFYCAAENTLQAQFLHQVPLIRIFPNEAYAQLWEQRIDEGLRWVTYGPSLPSPVRAPFGCGLVPEAGYVDLPVLLNALASRLSAEGRFHQVTFDVNKLQSTAAGVEYHDDALGLRLPADAAILATGTFARQLANDALPLNTNKGEVLTVKTTAYREPATLNNGKWLLPIGDGQFRLGASYLPGAETVELTDSVRQHLLEKASLMLDAELEVVEHRAGLRPTVSDRRPLLGATSSPHVFHFNGMGTRGVLNAPLLARWMADHLLANAPLPKEVDVARFGSTV